MLVPCSPTHAERLVNKQMVYSDKILTRKDNGRNLIVTSLPVSEEDIEKCLKIIFEANPDVIFNTIQYSKYKQKIYFYTDKKVSTKEYSDLSNSKSLTTVKDVLEEIWDVLGTPICYSEDTISLYDISVMVLDRRREIERSEKYFESEIKPALHISKEPYENLRLSFENNRLVIRFKWVDDGEWRTIYFNKKDGDIYIEDTTSWYGIQLLSTLHERLSEVYDTYLFNLKYDEYRASVKSVNSNFLVTINYIGEAEITTPSSGLSIIREDFEFKTEVNSGAILGAIQGKEEELFKRIYVKITDCPMWLQTEIKRKKLRQERAILEEEKKRENRRRRIRRIFPFIK